MTRPTDPNPARALARSRWDNDPRTSLTCAECHAPMDTIRIYCSGRCRTRARRRLAREAKLHVEAKP